MTASICSLPFVPSQNRSLHVTLDLSAHKRSIDLSHSHALNFSYSHPLNFSYSHAHDLSQRHTLENFISTISSYLIYPTCLLLAEDFLPFCLHDPPSFLYAREGKCQTFKGADTPPETYWLLDCSVPPPHPPPSPKSTKCTSALHFRVGGKHFENGAFRKKMKPQ